MASRVASIVLFVFLLAAQGSGAVAQTGKRMPPPDPDRPTHGMTDTTRVERGAITLKEIISRAIEGEKSKLLGRSSLTYTMSVRTIVLWEKDKKEIHDVVLRAYSESNGFSRFVTVNESTAKYDYEDGTWKPEKNDEDEPSVQVVSDGHSDFTDLPFFLEEIEEFEFELLGRTLEVDHVIFEIGFKPKSDFKPLPSGTIYIDTNDYRIIHEEFRFAQNPFPMVLKNVHHVSRHWERLPTGEWVFTRVLAEMELHGWFGKVPNRVQVSVERSDFAFDEPYSVRQFGER